MSEAFEGSGMSRRELYGKDLIAHLSNRLTLSAQSGQAEKIRQPATVESERLPEIGQTLSVQSFSPGRFGAAETAAKSQLYLPSKHEPVSQVEDIRRELEIREGGNSE